MTGGARRWQPVPERWPREAPGTEAFAGALQELYLAFERFAGMLVPHIDQQLGISTAPWRSTSEGAQNLGSDELQTLPAACRRP